jgi:predicted transposase/invertase (TIGR01784 family)
MFNRTKISLDPLFTEVKPDIYGYIGKNTVTNVEMHSKKSETGPDQKYDIRKRSRLYQSIIDSTMLKTGGGYNELDDVLIIICASFDVFGLNLSKYTFTNMCLEAGGLLLGDGAYRIFLNTTGEDGGTNELRALLKYTEESVAENATNDKLKDLHTKVLKVKQSKVLRERYMCEWEHDERLKDEGRVEGREEESKKWQLLVSEKEAALADKDVALAGKDALIAELEAQLAAKT